MHSLPFFRNPVEMTHGIPILGPHHTKLNDRILTAVTFSLSNQYSHLRFSNHLTYDRDDYYCYSL